jgi:hypothetical protein
MQPEPLGKGVELGKALDQQDLVLFKTEDAQLEFRIPPGDLLVR